MTHEVGDSRYGGARQRSRTSEGLALFFGESSAWDNASEWTVH